MGSVLAGLRRPGLLGWRSRNSSAPRGATRTVEMQAGNQTRTADALPDDLRDTALAARPPTRIELLERWRGKPDLTQIGRGLLQSRARLSAGLWCQLAVTY